MTKIYVNYNEEHISGGEICAGEENDAWPSHETAYYDYTVDYITLTNVSPYHEELELELPDPRPTSLWVVVVRYGTGGTFGSSEGHGTIQGAFLTEREALTRREAIEKGAPGIQGYSPWVGYFESLECVEIHLVPLKES